MVSLEISADAAVQVDQDSDDDRHVRIVFDSPSSGITSITMHRLTLIDLADAIRDEPRRSHKRWVDQAQQAIRKSGIADESNLMSRDRQDDANRDR